ncbi:MAG: SH3 domain-containing protein [Phycisphaerales bacterium]|nr:SH3 domain-containing protein [Phycisphaerales bacterium]
MVSTCPWRGTFLLASALLVGTLPGAYAADALSPARQREVLRAAVAAYERGSDLRASQPVAAQAAFQEALGGFLALRAAGVDNAALEFNLGNTYYRIGDTGRAVLHLRRATQLAPGEARMTENLHFVRARVEPQIPSSVESQVWRQLAFLHYETPAAWRFTACLSFILPGWLLLFLWLRWPVRGLLFGGGVCVLLGLTFAASLLYEQRVETTTPAAVVLTDAPLRHGRGAGADLALDRPLGPGVEVRILDERGDWIQVELNDGRTGWLPADSLARV